jgi:two-component system sensor histidine kinase DesK
VSGAARTRTQFLWLRGGQLLGLLFLAGPVSDLADEGAAPARVAAIAAVLAAFVALYLALLPPVRPIARRGRRALDAGLVVLALLAALALALGAPQSFALLYIYVVVAAGFLVASRVAVAVTLVTAMGVGTGLAVTGSSDSVVFSYTLTILALGAMMAAFGSALRTNRELRAAREELAQAAVSEERLRIARDLHDLLGHTLSVIALKAELAGRLVRSEPARAEAELGDVLRVARQALGEVREAVHGYRALGFEDALDGARAALSAAGIDCRVEAGEADLPADVESVLAWAVREAATNVVRHSGARECAITLSADEDRVALEVRDDGAGSDGDGAGAGLAGLAERASRLHGTLEAGARPEGGFRLRLTLPLHAT